MQCQDDHVRCHPNVIMWQVISFVLVLLRLVSYVRLFNSWWQFNINVWQANQDDQLTLDGNHYVPDHRTSWDLFQDGDVLCHAFIWSNLFQCNIHYYYYSLFLVGKSTSNDQLPLEAKDDNHNICHEILPTSSDEQHQNQPPSQ